MKSNLEVATSAQRNKLMGHASNATFEQSYEIQTLDIQAIFLNQE